MPKRKPGSYEVQHEGEEIVIRFDWLGFPHSPSISDDPETMSRVIDAILEAQDVDRIVIAEAYEYEYPKEQTGYLAEIAGVIDRLLRDDNILEKTRQIMEAYPKCIPNAFGFVQKTVIEDLRKDPISAYLRIRMQIHDIEKNAEYARVEAWKECYKRYREDVLGVIREQLEETRIIKNIMSRVGKLQPGDRKIYDEIFKPTLRPNFTLTRYMMKPPAHGELVDTYTLGEETDVEIYKLPHKTENYYHVIPPEFKLAQDQYTVLGLARKVMLGYKPSTKSFTQKTREYFRRVGKDLIGTIAGEEGIQLAAKDVEKLATILARYTAGLGIMEILLADPKLQDIYLNAPIGEKAIRVLHSDWEECATNLIPTREDAEAMASRFRLESGRPLDEAEPVLDTSTVVPGGRARVCAITKSLSSRGLAFAFRRHRSKPWTYPLFIKNNTISPLAAGLLWFVVDGGRSMLFAGPRSSGKTSLLGSTIAEIMKKYRIITIEDTLELPVQAYRELGFNILSLKVQSVITKLEAEVPADEGIRTALRLGDSCLIIGEVRSTEARALYEAMRIGALSNVVAGTIHGDDPYGVWDRVVNDLGVPTTSFKATDLLIMPAPIRSADGLHRYRRVFTITEIGKDWTDDPMKEDGFKELMKYNAKKDLLEPTDILLKGESVILNSIASKVREWAGDWEAIWENIQTRGEIKQKIVELAEKSGREELLEAPFTGDSNNMYHIISEDVTRELGAFDNKEIYKRWEAWAKGMAKGGKGETAEAPEEIGWGSE